MTKTKTMKKVLTILLCCGSLLMSAQDFSGKATYKTHRKTNISLDSTMNSEMQKKMQERIRQMFQQTYTLSFNKEASIYKQNEKLKSPNPQASTGGFMVMSVGGGSNEVTYKNLKKNKLVQSRDLLGKLFLIKDDIEKAAWKLTGETKNIGTYTCYKASYSREVENTNIVMENGESKEKTTKNTVVTTAWYTPEIPISNGPANYGGLPGLILEINEGNLTIVCTEIEMKGNEKMKIEAPTKGKVVNSETFEKISRQKTKEMMERMRTRRGDGNHMEIRIGG